MADKLQLGYYDAFFTKWSISLRLNTSGVNALTALRRAASLLALRNFSYLCKKRAQSALMNYNPKANINPPI